MSGLDASIGLLNRTTFTEHRYNQLYVIGRCCLVALVNRILFYLFSSWNCVLRDAAGPVSLQEERAALRAYNNAKSALLTAQNEKTLEVFCRAFNKRREQLYKFDETVTFTTVKRWWKADIQDTALFKKAYNFPFEKTKGASQSSLENVVALFAQNRDLEAEPLRSAIRAYVDTLRTHGEDFNLPLTFLYERLDEDVFEACCANNRSVPGEIAVAKQDSRFMQLLDIFSLKWAIFQFFPVKKDFDLDTMFLHIFSSECQRRVCGKEYKAILESPRPYSAMIDNMATCVVSVENVYKQLALYLGQSDAEGVPDIKRLSEKLAFHIFLNIDEAIIKSCKEKLEQTDLREDPREELSNFLTAHNSFTREEEEETALVQEKRTIFISSVEKRILKMRETTK